MKYDKGDIKDVLRSLKNPKRLKALILGHIVLIVLSLCMAICFNALLSYFGATDGATADTMEMKQRSLLLEWVYIVVLAPLYEELLFRYFLYHRIKLLLHVKGRSLILATASSFLFGIYHNIPFLFFRMGPDYTPQVIYAFVMGEIFCIIYDWSKDLGSTFILHMMINLMATALTGTVVFDFLLDSNPGRLVSFVIGIPLMMLCWMIFKRVERVTNELDIIEEAQIKENEGEESIEDEKDS